MKLRSVCLLLALLLSCLGLAPSVWAEEKYPSRPVDLLCGFSAGGATDLSGRVTAGYLNRKWGVPINVINKPGGNTVPVGLELHKAAPDGYTMMVETFSSSSSLPINMKNLPFKVTDRTYVAATFVTPIVLVVPAASKVKSLKELVELAKADPGAFKWTSIGGVAGVDFAVRQFFKAARVDVKQTKPIMAKGGGEAVTLTAGGHVTLGSLASSSALPVIRGGMVRAMAVTSPKRLPELPDVPTAAELGYPEINAQPWYGISGPPKLSERIVAQWGKALEEMLADADTVSKVRNAGLVPLYINSQALQKLVTQEIADLTALWGGQ